MHYTSLFANIYPALTQSLVLILTDHLETTGSCQLRFSHSDTGHNGQQSSWKAPPLLTQIHRQDGGYQYSCWSWGASSGAPWVSCCCSLVSFKAQLLLPTPDRFSIRPICSWIYLSARKVENHNPHTLPASAVHPYRAVPQKHLPKLSAPTCSAFRSHRRKEHFVLNRTKDPRRGKIVLAHPSLCPSWASGDPMEPAPAHSSDTSIPGSTKDNIRDQLGLLPLVAWGGQYIP